MKYIILSFLFCFSTTAMSLTAEQRSLKQQIIKLASMNTNNMANRPVVRAELDNLITQLTSDLPLVTAQTWTQHATGSWKQLWADEQNNGPSEIGQNLDRIFQYVTIDGKAVNLGERILPNGQRVTFALRARGAVNGNIQKTTILEGFFKDTPLLSGMSISYLAKDILDQRFAIFTPTNGGTFPNGPINAESDLTFSYLDEDLKVGTAPNVYTGFNEMFILVRQEIIP